MTPFSCPACSRHETAATLEKGRYRYLVCGSCGTASLESGKEDADYEAGYFTRGDSAGYFDYDADRRIHLETAHRRLDSAERVTPDLNRVVDVGAALGFTLQAARSRGSEAVGVEVSMYATGRLQDAGYEVHRSLAELRPGEFDAVLFGQVLEHMPDPNRAVAQAVEALRPGGAVFIETWDLESSTAKRFGARWQQISPPVVVHLFTERGLRTLLERHGLDVDASGPWRKRVSIRGYLGVLASKLPSGLGRAMLRSANAVGITKLAVTYRFDDLIFMIARKPED